MRSDILDLINRQKAEIERLKKECLSQIEGWKRHYESLCDSAVEVAKSEAIKEFAERLKPSNAEKYISYAKVKRLAEESDE